MEANQPLTRAEVRRATIAMLIASTALDIEQDEIRSRMREMADRVLAEGRAAGDNCGDWILTVTDDKGVVVMSLSMAQAAGYEGLSRPH